LPGHRPPAWPQRRVGAGKTGGARAAGGHAAGRPQVPPPAGAGPASARQDRAMTRFPGAAVGGARSPHHASRAPALPCDSAAPGRGPLASWRLHRV